MIDFERKIEDFNYRKMMVSKNMIEREGIGSITPKDIVSMIQKRGLNERFI